MTELKSDIYRELQRYLDKMPIGFPSTDSGVEIRILKRFFSPEEARIAMKLNFIVKTLEQVYEQVKDIGMTIGELEQTLDKMAEKGSINLFKREEEKGEVKYYSTAFLAVGIFEYKVNDLDREFCEDLEQYMNEAFLEEMTLTKIPQLRTIPLDENVTIEHHIATYDDIKEIIKNVRGPITVTNCVCKQKKDVLGQPCNVTDMREICLQFGIAAKSYIERGLGRQITKEESLKILQVAEKEGLVLQPGNAKYPSFVCVCCGCCCEYLGNKKKLPHPVEFFATNYYAEVDPDLCTGCGTCLNRCQMEALTLIDDISNVDRDRCIGCGICGPTCPVEAIKLQKKEKETIPPKNPISLYTKILDIKSKIKQVKEN